MPSLITTSYQSRNDTPGEKYATSGVPSPRRPQLFQLDPDITNASNNPAQNIKTYLVKPYIMPSHVNFITGNANKLKEVKLFLEPAIEVRSEPIDIEEVQGTIEEVTKSKCRKAAEMVFSLIIRLCKSQGKSIC